MINSEGKRFCNEGAIPQLTQVCLRQPHGLCTWVSDANWKKIVGAAPLDHGAPNFGMDDYMVPASDRDIHLQVSSRLCVHAGDMP